MNEDGWIEQSSKRKKKSNSKNENIFNSRISESRNTRQPKVENSGLKKVIKEGDITTWMEFVIEGNIENRINERLTSLLVNINGKICKLWDCIFYQFMIYFPPNERFNDGIQLRDHLYKMINTSKPQNDHNALKKMSEEYKFQLRISTVFDKLKDIIYGTNLMMVIHILHIGMDLFLPLIGCGNSGSNYQFSDEDQKLIQNLNLIQSKNIDKKREIEAETKHLCQLKKLVQGKEKIEDYEPPSETGKKKLCYDIYTPEQLDKMKNLFICKLKLKNAHSGVAIPIEKHTENMKFKEINLLNRRNCGYNAFDNDLVYVKINNSVTHTGKVMGVHESNHKPVNNIYICKVSRDQGSLMMPLDKFFPKIHVDNEPGRRVYEKNDMKHLRESNLTEQQKTVVDIERESAKYADNKYFSLFKMSMKAPMEKPEFFDGKAISFDPETFEKLFIVCYEYWDPYFMYPFGRIVGLISTHESFNDNFHLISSICDIETSETGDTCKKEIEEIVKKSNSLSYIPGEYLPFDAMVFTIDSETTEDMDDALSYHRTESKVVVGVHISDVTKYISPTHRLYKEAEKRFCTSYPPKFSKIGPIHIMGNKLARETFSLIPGKPRAVISVFFEFNEDAIMPNGKEFPDFTLRFSEGIIVSKGKLSYDQVAVWLNQSEVSSDINEDLFISLKDIYEIAKKVRRKRLPESYFVRPINDYHKDFQIDEQFEARILIEEFMILTNECVAKKIYEKYPDLTLLRVQEPVLNYEEWRNKLFRHTNMKFAAQLKDCCNLLRVPHDGVESKKSLWASRKFYDTFCEYINNDINKARILLQYDAFYNDFFLHITEWYIINNRALYQCSVKDSSSNGHFSLDKQLYTHFTSPIRRFADIIIHRFLKAIINNSEIECDSSDIDRVCQIGNKKMKNNKNFEKICSTYSIFEETGKKCCFILDCLCSSITNEKLSFAHPLLEKATCNKELKFADLSLDEVPVATNEQDYVESCILKWRKMIFPCSEINRTIQSGKFTIDNHSFDCECPWTEYKLFREIRRSYKLAESLEDQLKKLKSKIKTYKDQIIYSDSSSIANPIIDIELKIFLKNTMRIQFCKYKINGFQNIKPELYILTSTFQICLIHQDDPARFFIPGGKLKLKNNDLKKRFQSIKEYKEYFKPLVEVESLVETLNENSEFTLLSVDIKWLVGRSSITKNNEKYGFIVLPYTFCELKSINFNDEMTEFQDRMENIISKGTSSIGGDLLCLRCKPKQSETYWIGHGEVVNVGKWEEGPEKFKVIVFLLTHSNYDLSIDNSEDNEYTVDVYLRSVVSKRQIQAITSIQDHPLLKDVILGNQIVSLTRDDQIINEIRQEIERGRIFKFNQNQRRAMDKAMNDKISLIWGPPGTGKTHIGCIMSYAYVYRNRITESPGVVLYCGPSNDCVNLVTLEMKRKFCEKCPKLLRIFGKQQEYADFPVPGHFTKNHVPLTGELQEDSLHYLIRKDNEDLVKFDRYFQNVLNNNSNSSSKHFGEDILRAVLMYKEVLRQAKEDYIKTNNFEMVLCTTSVTASAVMDVFKVTQIIIDEAGMCKEPETLIPISSAESNVENVVLIGDHKQLRPIIKSQLAKKRGLEISLFERYQALKPDLVTMLNFQYRMNFMFVHVVQHPSICEFPSKQFYNGRLKTQVSSLWSGLGSDDIQGDYSKWNGIDYSWTKGRYYKNTLDQSNYNAIPNGAWVKRKQNSYICFDKPFDWYPERILFIDVVGDEIIQSVTTASGNENSRGNKVEVKTVGHIYGKIIQRLRPPRQAPSFITVLTQYKLQQHLIEIECRQILKERRINTSPIVKTVIRSQGSENDYIIFSTVRSIRNEEDINYYPTPGWERKNLGFITDPNQINVALTRAKKGLIIIGNRRLLEVNYVWKKLILNLEERKCVIQNYFDFLN